MFVLFFKKCFVPWFGGWPKIASDLLFYFLKKDGQVVKGGTRNVDLGDQVCVRGLGAAPLR